MTGRKNKIAAAAFAVSVGASGAGHAAPKAAVAPAADPSSVILNMSSQNIARSAWTSVAGGQTHIGVYRNGGRPGQDVTVVRANVTGRDPIATDLDRDVRHIDCSRPVGEQMNSMYRVTGDASAADVAIHNRAVHGAETLANAACRGLTLVP